MVLINGIWVKASPENFPEGKLTAVFPYPPGTGRGTHNFKVVHMFTVELHGHKPGQAEMPEVKKTADGIQVELDGLSPVAISWMEIDDTALKSLPKTGDTENNRVYLGILAAALAGIGLILLLKKRR